MGSLHSCFDALQSFSRTSEAVGTHSFVRGVRADTAVADAETKTLEYQISKGAIQC